MRALRTLVEIDRIGSFAAAAERLGMTLSTLSVQMKTLEDELQFALFDRRHRPPQMTPAARQVAVHARTILAEVDAVRGLGDEPGALKGVLRVGFVGTASVRLLPDFLSAAALRQPAARFEVESGLSTDLLRRVARGELDAAVVTESPDMPLGVRIHRLRREAFALACPQDAPQRDLVRCCAELAFIRFLPSTGIGLIVDNYLRHHAGPVRETVTLDSVEAVMGCVNRGLGFAVLPEPDARRYASAAHVAALDAPPLERYLSIAVQEDGPGAVHAEALRDLFEAVAA
ncbi:LysR family transcriptional regulator [Acuticoccus mangrovi]|uniref:LysR family transcriptional regulator n=1 Tax=Acuticoccus mangrovi TaxID=2796142 RepID=A0A934IQB3_9HYPH|nr:LysR family transcriptional regulator [Acuticoccus mangrovi]MBJ3776750.1 LysR family transcriptional regulator [Acuticoccus mangrovi]